MSEKFSKPESEVTEAVSPKKAPRKKAVAKPEGTPAEKPAQDANSATKPSESTSFELESPETTPSKIKRNVRVVKKSANKKQASKKSAKNKSRSEAEEASEPKTDASSQLQQKSQADQAPSKSDGNPSNEEVGSNDDSSQPQQGRGRGRGRNRNNRQQGRPDQREEPKVKVDAKQVAKRAWKIFLGEVNEEGLALIADKDARELARRSLRVAEIYSHEEAAQLQKGKKKNQKAKRFDEKKNDEKSD